MEAELLLRCPNEITGGFGCVAARHRPLEVVTFFAMTCGDGTKKIAGAASIGKASEGGF